MTSRWKRYVVGPDAEGRSAVLEQEQTSVQSREGFFWRATLWATQESPPDNTIEGDRTLGVSTREPAPSGLIYRAMEIPPDVKDKDKHREVLEKLNVEVAQKHAPSDADLARHPSMHRTDTLDCITCVIGEIYLVTDVEEVLMRPGDTVVIRGTNHAATATSAGYDSGSSRSTRPSRTNSVLNGMPGAPQRECSSASHSAC